MNRDDTKKVTKTAKAAPLRPSLYKVEEIHTSMSEISGVPKGTKFEITEIKNGGIYRAVWINGEKNGQEFLIEEHAID